MYTLVHAGMNVIFGIIVDTFSELRNLKASTANLYVTLVRAPSFSPSISLQNILAMTKY